MQLSQTAEYALRAMAVLANAPGDGVVRSVELAGLARIPPHYASKVMRALVRHELVESRKGHHGGFRLARTAEGIRVIDVLHAVDGKAEDRECAFGWARCDELRPCPLHPIWARMKEGCRRWAETTTLAEVGGVEHLIDGSRGLVG